MKETYTFGNRQAYPAARLLLQDGRVDADTVVIPRHPDIDPELYGRALDDVNSTLHVAIDAATGRRFEVAWANRQADSRSGATLELATARSSITGNLSNAVELAEHSALEPDRPRIYIASPGNGGTSYWSALERQYIRRTGRFVQENGEPLPTIAALGRVLRLGGFAVTKFSSNSAGGTYATALMSTLPEGQVTHAYIKSRPNISNHRFSLTWGASVLLNDVLNDRRLRQASRDPWRLTGELIEQARERMPDLYGSGGLHASYINHESLVPGRIRKVWTDTVTFSRGGESYGHPAAKDTEQALRRQPDAHMTYHFPLSDRLYRTLPRDATAFLMAIGAAASGGQVEVLFMPGVHRDHTVYPSLRWSVESYALHR